MNITEFLEARIAEDEKRASYYGMALGTERVLAECAAKRAIIAMHRRDGDVQRMVYGDIYPCAECGDVDDSPVEWPCPTLRAVAAVYKDHADYQHEWAL